MRDWWLRTVLVLQHPRPVFVALRDESKESIGERSEPILLIVWLAGIAGILTAASHYLDDTTGGGLVVAIWAFLGGGIYGFFAYFAFGALLYFGGRAFGSQGSYRRARGVLAFAAVPIALSLVLWPFKLALYGEDWFRSGGRDTGAGGLAFDLVGDAFLIWSAVLLVIGVRAVHGWTWGRSLAACALAIAATISVSLVLSVL